MSETKVTILNEFNEKLVGIETSPDVKKEKYPTIILVHGFATGKDKESIFSGLIKNLSIAGFLIYRFDFSGCGESEGDYSKTSLSKLKSDLEKMINFVKSQPKVDNSKIGILAQSTGTAVTVALEPQVNCIVLAGSIFHYKEVMADIFGGGYNPTGISVRTKANGTITKIGPQFWEDIKNHNLLESVKKIHCPILFVHGAEDEKVPVSEMEAYFANTNEPKQKMIIEKANHSFEPNREELYKIAVDWFKKYLIEKGNMGSKIIIVDENDNIISHKERENLKAEDIYRVSALWITNSKDEILLARRALSKSHSPGKWGPATAGTVEEGETYYSNIIKEAKEELGLENIKPKTGPKIRVAEKYNYFYQWFLQDIDKSADEFKIQKSEVEELKWVSRKELLGEIKNNPDNFVEAMKEWVKLLAEK